MSKEIGTLRADCHHFQDLHKENHRSNIAESTSSGCFLQEIAPQTDRLFMSDKGKSNQDQTTKTWHRVNTHPSSIILSSVLILFSMAAYIRGVFPVTWVVYGGHNKMTKVLLKETVQQDRGGGVKTCTCLYEDEPLRRLCRNLSNHKLVIEKSVSACSKIKLAFFSK